MTLQPDPNRPRPSKLFRLIVALARPILRMITKREWSGAENFPAGGFIAVTNHISDADPVGFVHFLVDHGIYPAILGKKELFQNPVIGRIFRAIGVIPVERETIAATLSLGPATNALQAGQCVVIYPEGTHTFDPDLWPMRAKTGAARLAIAAGVPIVPIGQWGAHKVRHPHTRKWRIRRYRSQVLAGKPIYLDEYGTDPMDTKAVVAATEHIMREVTQLVAQLRGETPPERLYDRSNGRPQR